MVFPAGGAALRFRSAGKQAERALGLTMAKMGLYNESAYKRWFAIASAGPIFPAWISGGSGGVFGMRLEDVAKKANVSTATVSRVLNGVEPIKSSTRKRVLKAIQELKYRPNLHARALAAGRSRSLGMIVSNLSNPFFLDIFRGFEAAALAKGYEVLVSSTDYDRTRLVSSVHSMMSRQLAGLALVVSEMEPDLINELAANSLPVVFYDVGIAGKNSTNIRVNYQVGMQTMIEYLHQLGHRRMAFVGHHTTLGPLQERHESFLAMMRSQYRDTEFVSVLDSDSPFGGVEAAREVLDSGFEPTVILCVNDYTAMGVLAELRDRGIHVPQQISVTGFDNISLAQFVCPPLTTVNIPRDRIAELMFQALLPEQSPDPVSGKEISIKPELVIRETTGPAATNGK
jgi:LacI family transcriptional regulator